MVRPLAAVLFALFLSMSQVPAGANSSDDLNYNAAGQMKFPVNYREWIYLTSGLDMSYTASGDPDHHMFDNVFVNQAAYKTFVETGKWPDRTVMVLEVRGAESKTSINQRGHTQSPEVMGFEVHVKDKNLPGGWGFFEFDERKSPAKVMDRSAACYSCHEMHGAVDTTFVQFYPTLIGVAKVKGTLSADYLRGIAAPKN